LEMQNRQLQDALAGRIPPTQSFTPGRSYSDIYGYNLPPVQQLPPPPQSSYTLNGYNGRFNAYNTRTTGVQGVATGLDHLAQAAMSSSVPTADPQKHNESGAQIDPNLASVPLTFPNFPHDIFIPGAETYATQRGSRAPPSVTSDDWGRAQLVPFGSEADGLPPKELLEIMYTIKSVS
jgi:hypothetical protein